MDSGQNTGIWGGLTAADRRERRKDDTATGRELAVRRGADIVVWLVKQQLPVEDVAERLECTRRAVYRAWRLLVPPAQARPLEPTPPERVVNESGEIVRIFHGMGRSPEAIARVVGTSPGVVQEVLRLIKQRDAAWKRLKAKRLAGDSTTRGDAVRVAQAQEWRVRWEAGEGVTLREVVKHMGPRIMLMRGRGRTYRQIAMELDLNRETVRQAAGELGWDPLRSPRTAKPAAAPGTAGAEEPPAASRLSPSLASRTGFNGGQASFLKGYVAA